MLSEKSTVTKKKGRPRINANLDESRSVLRTLTRLADVFVAFASVRRNARLALPALAK